MIPWIQVYSNVGSHPKTARLAELLEIKSGCVNPSVVAVGILVSLWSWAVQNAYDGDLSQMSDRAIADVCRWKKSPSLLTDALAAAGFLDPDGHLHDWAEYAVLFMEAKERENEKTKERMRRYRERKKEKRNANVTVTLRESYAPTIPDHTKPNLFYDDNGDTRACEGEKGMSENGNFGAEQKAPLCKGGCRGEAETEGLYGGDVERTANNDRAYNPSGATRQLPLHRGAMTLHRGGINGAHLTQGRQESDDAVSAAIRRHWGREPDERDLTRGRREFFYFGEDGKMRVYDAALVDYVFNVSERAGEKAQNWRFIEGVMRKLRQRRIMTVEDALDYDEERG